MKNARPTYVENVLECKKPIPFGKFRIFALNDPFSSLPIILIKSSSSSQ